MPLYKKEPSGGIGCFTADSFPVFVRFCDNVYVIADSNHGYKMIGVGKLVADDIVGAGAELLEPFRFSRFAAGRLHPVSNSPYHWSRSEEHTSELQSLMSISYAVFCSKKKK